MHKHRNQGELQSFHYIFKQFTVRKIDIKVILVTKAFKESHRNLESSAKIFWLKAFFAKSPTQSFMELVDMKSLMLFLRSVSLSVVSKIKNFYSFSPGHIFHQLN